jgi:polysaccharide export outer membrane protein
MGQGVKAATRIGTGVAGAAYAGPMILLAASFLAFAITARAQTSSTTAQGSSFQGTATHTVQDYNQRMLQLVQQESTDRDSASQDYHIGADDLLQISVYEAADLGRTVRVSADGQISLPPLGTVRAAGLTSRQLEAVLEELLRRTYMKDPHVGVFVKEMQSHPVSVFGAVQKPGVYQIRGPRSLLEVLSMAQGLANDAGDTVIVMRHGGASTAGSTSGSDPPAAEGSNTPAGNVPHGPAASATLASVSVKSSAENSIEVNLKELLDSGDPRSNVLVYPGDVVKVARAGIVYVIGEVNKPGGYVLKTNENISVLQAIALAEGLTHTASGKHARIIRTDALTGVRRQIPINLGKILSGHAPDPVLQAKDILFVPNNAVKAAFYHSTEGIVGIVSGAAIYRW